VQQHEVRRNHQPVGPALERDADFVSVDIP
jgi:hypothetical protein